MNSIFLVACLVGVYFASSGHSFTVKHGLRHEQMLNESMQERKYFNQEKPASEHFKVIDKEHNMEIIGHSKHKIGTGDIQTENPKSKPDTFAVESLLNLNNGKSDNNGPSLLGRKERHNNHIQYEKEDKNEEYDDTTEDESDIWIKIEDSEDKSESQEAKSNDQQNENVFSSDESSEQYESSVTKFNIQSAELDENGNKGYVNILEEAYDDEDLKYVLNITQDDDTSGQNIKIETHKEVYIEEPNREDAIYFTTSESEIHINEQDDDDDSGDSRIRNLIHEQNDTKVKLLSNDFNVSQKESSQGEEKSQQSEDTIVSRIHKIRGDVPDVEYSGEMTDYRQSESNTDLTPTTAKSPKNPGTLLNSSEVQVDHDDHDFDSAMEKEEDSKPEMNKMKLSSDPCNNFHCKRGKTCGIDGQGNPFCACQDPDFCLPANLNDRVCGTDNKTYTSACHLFGTKCQLEGTKEGSHLHLDYQGPCKYIPSCTDYELAHFPFRMRDWLKNVLMQLYERGLENTGLLSEKQRSKVKKIYENEKRLHEGDHNIDFLVKDFQKNYHMYVYPVHWQFNQLDQHSMDRLLTRSELAPLRAPLIPMEHCVAAFLQECNSNNDKHISLQEWCHCFGIRDGDIDEDLLF